MNEPTTLEVFMYKTEVLNYIKKVFPHSEQYSTEKESWIEVHHTDRYYGARFPSLHSYIVYGVPSEDVAHDMLCKLTKEILEKG